MIRSRLFAAILLVVGLGAQVARADDEGFGRSGPYLAVGASRALNLFEQYLDSEPLLSDIQVDDTWGVNARAGYRLTSWFALEGEYEWLDGLDAHIGSIGSRIGVQTATANFRLIAPLGRFQPYFLGGAGAVFLNASGDLGLEVANTAFAGRVGLGIDVYLTKSIFLNAGAEAMLTNARVSLTTPFGSVSENGLGTLTFQAGFGYRF